MNLSKGLVGETNANLLGSMLTTRIYLGAMSRADLPVAQMKTMPNFYFYVDEFQSFANATFANILSEARKYHLNLIIAHQYISQMEEEVRDAVFGNVGTTVSFRVGPFDAELLETVFTPRFLAADLVNLGFAQIYLTLMIDGIGSQPFSAITLPPVTRPSVSCKEMVIAASRRNYTKPREVVDKIITDLHTPVKVEKPAPKSNGTGGGNSGGNGTGGAKDGFRKPAAAVFPVVHKSPLPKEAGAPKLERQIERPVESPRTPEKPVEARPVAAAVSAPTPTTPVAVLKSVGTDERSERISKPTNPDRSHQLRRFNEGNASQKSAPRDLVATPKPMTPKDGGFATTQPKASLEDLRSVLAKISAPERKGEPGVSTHNKIAGSAHPKPIEPEKKVDLAAALKQIGATTETKSEATPVAPAVPVVPIAPHSKEPQRQPAAEVAPVRRSEAPETHRHELAQLAHEAEAAFAALESTAAPVASTQPDDPLAPKKIEQMFRQPRNERSPFTS